jgi:hypothetical protein
MNFVNLLIDHPFALIVLLIACLYAWSVFRKRSVSQPTKIRRTVRLFAPGVAVLILVAIACTGLKGNLPRVDFAMFYSSALLLKHDPAHLYDPQSQTDYLHKVTGLAGEKHYLPFAYPPVVALLFRPMTMLSFRHAYYLMIGINALLLTYSFWWLSTRMQFRREQLIAFLVVACATLPMYAVFVLGHMTFITLLLLSFFTIDILENRKFRPGLWAGLLLYKPIFIPVPLMLLLCKKRLKAFGLFLLTVFLMGFLSFVLVGWSGLLSNLAMMQLMTNDSLLPRTQSLRGLMPSGHLGSGLWIVAVVAVLTALWITVRRAERQHWILASAIAAILLVPPYLQFYDLSIGLLGIAFALASMNSISDKTRNYLFLLAFVPPALVLAAQRYEIHAPIMPILLIALFCYCFWRAHASLQSA